MKFSHLEFTGVKGVGSIEVDFSPDKSVYAFIGENGVGKTKFLEALYRVIISINKTVVHASKLTNPELYEDPPWGESTLSVAIHKVILNLHPDGKKLTSISALEVKSDKQFIRNINPVVFIAAQNRGFIQHRENNIVPMTGDFRQRRQDYIRAFILEMENNFSSLNMDINIEQWFISIAQSSNPFQKKEDNRQIEIFTILKLFNKIDKNIDPEFMEISGDNRVFLKLNGEKTQLSHLSTGYASILKIIQSIVSGYGYFTNEQQLQHVRGIVLIDEIESHLHLSWQSKIIPILKKLFPNTTFYITTHSPIVLTQLEDGEAYRLERENDGIVRSNKINHPGNATLVDVLDDAFKLDLNQQKLQKAPTIEQQQAKQDLLNFVKKQRELSSK